jgi:hypothetical protein
MTPAWILDVFAAVMLVVAAVSAARLAAGRPWQPGAVVTDSDVSHLLMGIAMAGVLAPDLATLPNDAWAAVFCVLTIWFGYRVARDYQANGARALAAGHCAPHLVHSAAMVYMFLGITAPAADGGASMAGMGGMSTLSVPTLAFAFALILVGYSIWDLDLLSSLGRGLVAAAAGAASPALAGASAGSAGTETGTADVAGPGAGAVAADPPTGLGETGGGDGRSGLVPILGSGTVVGCRIAMGVSMALMLLLMI